MVAVAEPDADASKFRIGVNERKSIEEDATPCRPGGNFHVPVATGTDQNVGD